ncbi:J domain-containing protein [Candidatus Pacearchaeota archaeon]|nr:J domain-containing protein [Candidatus Pacearchaeota archaeon]
MVKIKGNEIEAPRITGSYDRKAVQIQNHIVDTLKQIGIERDNVHMEMEKVAQKKAPASVTWYFNGRNLKYSYALMPRFVENLYIIDKVLKLEVEKLINEEINTDQFCREFSEDDDLTTQRDEARKLLGVEPGETDFELISKKYKDLARKHHPDMPEGDHEMFQKINAAHKLIQKELN